MLLPREQALRFINGYKPALLRVLENTNTASTGSINDDLVAARAMVVEDRNLLDVALNDLASEGAPVDPEVVSAIRRIKVGIWIYLKHTRTFAVFLDKEAKEAYAVRALTTPFNELLDEPPFAFETGVFEFQGLFVCDGLAQRPVALGPGYRSQLTAAYSRLRKSGHFHERAEATHPLLERSDSGRPTGPVNWRFATLADAAVIAAMNFALIRDEGHRNPMSVAKLTERMGGWLSGEYRCLLIEMSEAPIGYVLYRLESEFVYLRQLYVVPDKRRSGVGRQALAWLRSTAWSEQPRVRVEVLIDNAVARAFWRSVGFEDYCVTMEATSIRSD
jgi:GNAT superfamily N-acetyltransferase